ncbi:MULTISPECIES: RagB/SusD family nutrient uptake outer membrane protein [Niastella]|uniref:RagB/SusD family nutrient uptake outer membrane protein n=1 Tax=Niastella soli TaxID=2821487 RepID=A0ABS3YZ85_9BACT|nr:RagB/SusD family nutrient uptake outer membrane protein [Niastella soli]MBO9202705.1 RagB/SusD family nutrient uptake outer membrane protein [Niastella soli]
MKKHIFLIVCVYGLLQGLYSCKKEFLDEKLYSNYAPETLTDSLGFDAAAIGLYYQLGLFFSKSDAQGWPSVWNAGTDIAYVPPTQKQGIEVPYYDYTQLISTDGAASFTWQWAYQLINNANNIIANAENPALTKVSQGGKDVFNAEARFFRAYGYNMLATLFGKVPIITVPLTKAKTDFVRASLDEVNALIVADLTFAADKLPTIDNVKSNAKGKLYGRANKAMAQQLLAETYLRMGKNDLAETQCKAVIQSGKFSLTSARYGIRSSQPGDPFSDMFIFGNQRYAQGNKEAIWVFELENISSVVGGYSGAPQQRRNWGAAYYQITDMTICDSLGGRGIGRMRLTDWVVYGLYGSGDMRNSEYNIRHKFYYNTAGKSNYGQLIPYAGADTVFKIAPHTTKWYQYDPNDVFGFAMIKDFILMRLGETYLLMAEAQFKQNKLADAAASLNVVRARANATPVAANDVTMDFILDERARELLAEENRRMTLMRTKTLVDRTTKYNTQKINPVLGIASKNLLLPIPQSERDLNKDAVLEQNDGY